MLSKQLKTVYNPPYRGLGGHRILHVITSLSTGGAEHLMVDLLPKLRDLGNGSYEINAEEMIQGVAPGQFCVIYDDEHHKCYGSGEIAVM